MAKVAVVGGLGFIGRRLGSELSSRGHDVAAIGRESPLPAWGGADAIVNLAHPNRGPAYTWPAQNRRILRTIESLARADTRVIAVGTLAIFGDALERPAVAGPVPWRRDMPYVECKLELEAQLLARFRDVQVVRLGHVWGPGSPAWTGRLASHLRAGAPVGVRGRDGPSNCTDVGNVASYLAFLVDEGSPRGHGFHHLAELGTLPWSHFVTRMADALGLQPVLVDEIPELGVPRVLSVVGLLRGRRTGSWLRSVVRRVPPRILEALRPGRSARPLSWPEPGLDPALLRALTCPRRFESHLHAGWRPAIGPEESWEAVRAWLSDPSAGAPPRVPADGETG